jgi:hypothetical protein
VEDISDELPYRHGEGLGCADDVINVNIGVGNVDIIELVTPMVRDWQC